MGEGLKRAFVAAKTTRKKSAKRRPVESAWSPAAMRKQAERETLAALVRCGIAAASLAMAEAAYGRACRGEADPIRVRRLAFALDSAQAETCAAGAALDKAIKAARRGAK